MSNFQVLRSQLLGSEPDCATCGGSPGTGFNWTYANGGDPVDVEEPIAPFRLRKPLRRGWLYHCEVCQSVWHLDGNASWLTCIDDNQLALVLAWDHAPLDLPPGLQTLLDQIGPTPPDLYGNGRDWRVTPCSVETHEGEVFETAMICVQKDAPVQRHRTCRLGSEVAQIRESPFALTLEVRRASSRAPEVRMGFSPTLIEMPDKRRFVMNGMTSFMAVEGYDARDARAVADDYFLADSAPAFVDTPQALVYFIFDGDPAWLPDPSLAPAERRRGGWLQRLLGRA